MPAEKVFPCIPGIRLTLRPLHFDDLALTMVWRNTFAIRRWFVNSTPITWEQHQLFYSKYIERNDDFIYIIQLNNSDHTLIGQISLYNVDQKTGAAEFGRLMIGDRLAQGKGFAEEATKMIILDAFTTKGLVKVFLDVFQNNQPAVHIYSKMGFRVTKEEKDMLHMELMASDYLKSIG